MGSDVSWFFKVEKDSMVSFANSLPLYPESLCVSLKSGVAKIIAKFLFLMCGQKNLQSPRNDQIVFTSVGGFESLMALSLLQPCLILSGVKLNPR